MGKVNYFRTEVEFVGKPKTTKFADSVIRPVSQLFWEGRKVELFKTGSKDDYREIFNHPSGAKKARAIAIFLISIPILPLAFLFKAIDDDSIQNFKKYTVLKRTREQQVQNNLKAKKATHLENLEKMKRNLGDEELSKETQNLVERALRVMTPTPDKNKKTNHKSAGPFSPKKNLPEGKYGTFPGRGEKGLNVGRNLFGDDNKKEEPKKADSPVKNKTEKPSNKEEAKKDKSVDLFEGLQPDIKMETSEPEPTKPETPKQTGILERLFGSKPSTPNAEKKGEDLEAGALPHSPLKRDSTKIIKDQPNPLIDLEGGESKEVKLEKVKKTEAHDPLPIPKPSKTEIIFQKGSELKGKLTNFIEQRKQSKTDSSQKPINDEVVIQINDTPPSLSDSGKRRTRTRRRSSDAPIRNNETISNPLLVNPAVDEDFRLSSPTKSPSTKEKFFGFFGWGESKPKEEERRVLLEDLSEDEDKLPSDEVGSIV